MILLVLHHTLHVLPAVEQEIHFAEIVFQLVLQTVFTVIHELGVQQQYLVESGDVGMAARVQVLLVYVHIDETQHFLKLGLFDLK